MLGCDFRYVGVWVNNLSVSSQGKQVGSPVTRIKGGVFILIFNNHQGPFKFYTLHHFTFCRKEVRDPDVLYNMLKNILAQIKVRLPADHRKGKLEKQFKKKKKKNTFLQSHPDAWPFMEPVKKSEAPDYYEIIRFPIGQYPP